MVRKEVKNSAGMHESSGSCFFGTTTAIQSEPDAFDKSRFIAIQIKCRPIWLIKQLVHFTFCDARGLPKLSIATNTNQINLSPAAIFL